MKIKAELNIKKWMDYKIKMMQYRKNGCYYPREFIVRTDKQLAYLSVPKVACSSIKASMSPLESCDDDKIHASMDSLGFSRFGSLPENENSFFKFTFVRNPFERLVSCYENKYHTYRNYDANLNILEHYLDGSLAKDEGFEAFITKICSIPNFALEPHFMRQYDIVYDKHSVCLVDYIGKMESLQQDFLPIQEKYNLRPLPHYNKTGIANTNKWMNYYNENTAELVYNKYMKDFEVFGYEEFYTMLKEYFCNKNNDKHKQQGE